MPSYIPTTITRPRPYLLSLEWSDGKKSTFLLEKLREECPCAHCKGETIMGVTYTFGLKQFSAGMNELVSLVPVGNYGLQATWKDGHDSGIYTWEMLRNVAITHALSDKDIKNIESTLNN
ncbi:MAG: DUF971 domain-containing protein [Candidatus Kapabacteria bacterium]|nr:DUF971 domain-containing protein [Candidatus Kapabacteria bacterium]MBX7155652.1 DUF971 domain-containing protein [Bacteroidota bacterium]